MTRMDAQHLKHAWVMKGSPPCLHPCLALEKESDFLVGDYFCTECGVSILRRIDIAHR
jgi:hypothetical protein